MLAVWEDQSEGLLVAVEDQLEGLLVAMDQSEDRSPQVLLGPDTQVHQME